MHVSVVQEIRALRQALMIGPVADGLTEEGEAPHIVSPLDALAIALAETDVDLGTSKVRVGFSRGHLLEIVVQVPLDVEGDLETLEVAAETFLEACVGPERLDSWVACVSVDRIGRKSGLVMVQDSRQSEAESPLLMAPELITRGIQAVKASLGDALSDEEKGDWAALEIPRAEGGLQSEREFASTCFPEAIKAALEGLPFSSVRFTQGSEILVWLAFQWPSDREVHRIEGRALLEEAVRAEGKGRWALVGSGFGRRSDYLDLWIRPKEDDLRRLLQVATSLVGPLELGFYDDKLRPLGFLFEPEPSEL